MADDRKPPLRLVSNRTKGADFESFDRFIARRPRDRQRGLAPWLIREQLLGHETK
jgi:hypothetical protein